MENLCASLYNLERNFARQFRQVVIGEQRSSLVDFTLSRFLCNCFFRKLFSLYCFVTMVTLSCKYMYSTYMSMEALPAYLYIVVY